MEGKQRGHREPHGPRGITDHGARVPPPALQRPLIPNSGTPGRYVYYAALCSSLPSMSCSDLSARKTALRGDSRHAVSAATLRRMTLTDDAKSATQVGARGDPRTSTPTSVCNGKDLPGCLVAVAGCHEDGHDEVKIYFPADTGSEGEMRKRTGSVVQIAWGAGTDGVARE